MFKYNNLFKKKYLVILKKNNYYIKLIIINYFVNIFEIKDFNHYSFDLEALNQHFLIIILIIIFNS